MQALRDLRDASGQPKVDEKDDEDDAGGDRRQGLGHEARDGIDLVAAQQVGASLLLHHGRDVGRDLVDQRSEILMFEHERCEHARDDEKGEDRGGDDDEAEARAILAAFGGREGREGQNRQAGERLTSRASHQEGRPSQSTKTPPLKAAFRKAAGLKSCGLAAISRATSVISAASTAPSPVTWPKPMVAIISGNGER